MKILAMSDIHAQFERFRAEEMPPADLCVVAGDVTNLGLRSPRETQDASDWFVSLTRRCARVLWIPGNHDIGMTEETFSIPGLHWILDKTLAVDDPQAGAALTVHGVSLSPCYFTPQLMRLWERLTVDPEAEAAAYDFPYADLVLSHAPPHGILDFGERGHHHGSRALTRYIETHQPKAVVCGHVHGGAGEASLGRTRIYNLAKTWRVIEV